MIEALHRSIARFCIISGVSRREALGLYWDEFDLWAQEAEKVEAERWLNRITIQHGTEDSIKRLQDLFARRAGLEPQSSGITVTEFLREQALAAGDVEKVAELDDAARVAELLEMNGHGKHNGG